MTEAFDRPLVIGYLGFDVAVTKDGDISAPVPTFQIVEQRLPEPSLTMNRLSSAQQDVVTLLMALRGIASQPGGTDRAMGIIERVSSEIREAPFDTAFNRAATEAAAAKDAPESDRAAKVESALKTFSTAIINYTSTDEARGPRYDRAADVLGSAIFGR